MFKDDPIKVTLKRTLKTSIGSRVITINADYKKIKIIHDHIIITNQKF